MTVFEALPTDRTVRITRQAREWGFARAMAAFVRVLLASLAWLLVGVGKVAYWVTAGVWLAIAWTVSAVKVGWDDAHPVREQAGG